MPKVSEATLTSMEDLATHKTLLESIIAALDDKLKGLQQQITHETSLLVTTREQHDRLQADFKTEREVAQQRLNGELEAERLALKTKWAEVEQAQRDLGDVQTDLKRLADAQDAFQTEKQRLTDLSISIERDRVTASEQLATAEAREQAASTQVQEAITKDAEATKKLEAADALSQQAAQQLEQANLAVESNTATLTRLSALREEIDPKLQAVTEKEELARAASEKSEKLHGEAMQRIAEAQQLESDLHGLAARLEAREKKLLELHIQLRQYSLELATKAQQLKAQGAELSTPPEVPPVEPPSAVEGTVTTPA